MAGLTTRRETMLSFQPPAIGEEEIAAVAETLRSGWLTTGPRAAELEERFAEYVGAKHALAVASGTAALHLSVLALGVGPGDEVITSPITWPATANVIVHAGATPVFADVRESDLNIDPARVAELVTERTKAILPVHLAGQPCDMDPLLALGLPVVEDAAHAAESVYRGRKIGTLSDATCFSLYATKNVAAGEGGLVSTDRDDVAETIRNLRLTRRGDGSLYDIVVPGYKANLSDVLASIALACALRRGRRGRRRRASPPPRALHRMRRALRLVGTLAVTGLAIAYLVSKIDFHRTGHELAHAQLGYLFASLGLMVVTVWPMAWRWQRLLRAKRVDDRGPWLVGTYLVS